jgi:site-specific DNA-methyltransferase (adenine-specific)
MPALTWTTKSLAFPASVPLLTDSIIFPKGQGYPEAVPSNHLILGDNLAVMASLLPEYEGRIDLIYADPPFFTNRRYRARVGRGEDSRKPQEWQMAEGYPDHWEDLEAYLDMLYPRLALIHRLLSPTGTLYLHLDWHADAYARLLLDEIFGADCLLNEIIWVYHGPSPIRTAFNRKHDTILVYTKSENYTFNVDAVRQPYNPMTVKTFASSPKAGFGKIPDLERGKVPEDWWYFPVVARLHNERTGYPTQKPEALLERIILASSNPGDLVADFFCGSGTTAVVAARTGRRFIAVDGTWRAVHTTYTRLVEADVAPFTLQVETKSARIPESPGEPLPTHGEGEVSLKQDLLTDLDYWEVDPTWDGQVFCSAAQATRPHKKGQIRSHISLQPEQIQSTALARLVKIDGSRTLHHLLR